MLYDLGAITLLFFFFAMIGKTSLGQKICSKGSSLKISLSTRQIKN